MFTTAFLKFYFPTTFQIQKANECLNLRQGSMEVMEFTHKFNELWRYTRLKDEFIKMIRYEEALRPSIKDALGGGPTADFNAAVERACSAQANTRGVIISTPQAAQGVKRQWAGPPQQRVGLSSNKRPATSFSVPQVYPDCKTCG